MSLKKNYTYQIIYQILVLGIPLILSPYLTRTIGAESIGSYSYTYSIASYFVIVAMLGLENHGCRSIAMCRDNKDKLRKTIWSLMYIHFIFSIIAIISYIVFSIWIFSSLNFLFWIQLIFVFSSFFDVTWYFYGIEKFKSVIIKNFFLKLTQVILVFIFVRKPNDLGVYTLIMSGMTFVAQISLFIQLIKENKPCHVSIQDMKVHIKPLFILSLSVISINLYAYIDKTLLGFFSESKESVAFYDYSEKIVKIFVTIPSVIGTVMLPRMSQYIQKDNKRTEDYMKNSSIITGFISCAFAFGLCALSSDLIPLYYGETFAICSEYVMYLCPIIIFISFGVIIKSLYLIPHNLDKEYSIPIIFCALINVILDLFLIPIFGVIGAIIGTLVSEFMNFLLKIIVVSKKMNPWKLLLEFVPFALIGTGMLILIKLLQNYLDESIISLLLEFVFGFLFYILSSGIYLILFRKSILKKYLFHFKKNNVATYAYLYKNFGDDLFVYILSKRYNENTFVIFSKVKSYSNVFPQNVIIKNSFFSRSLNTFMKLISRKQKGYFDAIKSRKKPNIIIGGSLFIQKNHNYISFSKTKNLFLLGSNFGPFSDQEFAIDFKKKFNNSIDICFRDKYSYDLFSQSMSNVRYSDDIVFSLKEDFSNISDNNVVISVIDFSLKCDIKFENAYFDLLISLINYYLEIGKNILLMSFCKIENDESAIIKLLSYLPIEVRNKISTYFYDGNIKKSLCIFKSCEIVIGTRYHANILGMAFKKKVLPIIYSDKMINVLKDLNFDGTFFDLRKGDVLNITEIHYATNSFFDKLDGLEQFSVLDKYLSKKDF